MARRDRYALFNAYGVFLHHISKPDVESMLLTQRIRAIEMLDEAGEPTGCSIYVETKEPTTGAPTNCTITCADVKAYAGESGSRGKQFQVRSRIDRWGLASQRNNAVTVAADRIVGVIITKNAPQTIAWSL